VPVRSYRANQTEYRCPSDHTERIKQSTGARPIIQSESNRVQVPVRSYRANQTEYRCPSDHAEQIKQSVRSYRANQTERSFSPLVLSFMSVQKRIPKLSVTFREHSVAFREHSVAFREHSVAFREHSGSSSFWTLVLSRHAFVTLWRGEAINNLQTRKK
jgi:hypothetical protein